jgi:hypothetical protein
VPSSAGLSRVTRVHVLWHTCKSELDQIGASKGAPKNAQVLWYMQKLQCCSISCGKMRTGSAVSAALHACPVGLPTCELSIVCALCSAGIKSGHSKQKAAGNIAKATATAAIMVALLTQWSALMSA